MSQQVLTETKQRSERRIAVRLPLKVRGTDRRGFSFEEETASENLCRGGAAFRTRFDLAIGSSLEIRIPLAAQAWRRQENDFETRGRVVHVGPSHEDGERMIGVQFIGPRFQKLFRSEKTF